MYFCLSFIFSAGCKLECSGLLHINERLKCSYVLLSLADNAGLLTALNYTCNISFELQWLYLWGSGSIIMRTPKTSFLTLWCRFYLSLKSPGAFSTIYGRHGFSALAMLRPIESEEPPLSRIRHCVACRAWFIRSAYSVNAPFYLKFVKSMNPIKRVCSNACTRRMFTGVEFAN